MADSDKGSMRASEVIAEGERRAREAAEAAMPRGPGEPPFYPSDSYMFRPLSEEEMASFKQYALEHDPDNEDWSIYHPVCRAVWWACGKKPGPGYGGVR